MNRIQSSSKVLIGVTLLLVPLSGAVGVVAASAKTAPATHVMTCAHKLATKPGTYVISCADANSGWTGATWSTWTATGATGKGTFYQNDCTPNCAAGKVIKYKATIDLTTVKTTSSGKLFTQAVIHYSVNGKAKTQSDSLAD